MRYLLGLLVVLLSLGSTVLGSPAAFARQYSLEDLLSLAHTNNPGLAAGAQATAKVQAQLSEANRSWMPSGEVMSLVAPAPNVECQSLPGVVDPNTGMALDREDYCVRTNITDVSLNFRGVFSRTHLTLVQPLFTFGKISAGRTAALAGLKASQHKEASLRAEVNLNMKKAYYGVKVTQEILDTLMEGLSYLDDAQAQVRKNLDKGTGGITPKDELRLKTVRAELDVRTLEAEQTAVIAKGAIRALIGPDAPPELELAPSDFEPVFVPERPLSHYQEQARESRPEVLALTHLLASKRALADLERRKQYPDLVLLGSATYANASSIDNPQNAFLNDPFNSKSVGLAAAIRMPLDLGVRNARAAQVKAEAQETAFRRQEALGGIYYEVQKAHGQLLEAQKRLAALRRGERAAKSWVTGVNQSFNAGLAEPKEFTDALASWFQFRVRALQAIYDVNIAAATLTRTTGTEVTAAPPEEEDDFEEEAIR